MPLRWDDHCQINNHAKMNSRLNAQTISTIVTLITVLIAVTPLCGVLFQCGCDWPWSGLDNDCNIYKPEAIHQCPWCKSTITGLISTGLAMSGGVLTAMTASKSLVPNRLGSEMAARILCGLAVFVMVGLLTGGMAALWQNYALGLGSYLH